MTAPVVIPFADVAGMVGDTLGPGPWRLVDQALIDRFSDVTEDRAWYHVDLDRAATELPDGLTFAHGLLTLSLVPGMVAEIFSIDFPTRSFNYGYDAVRFLAPVQVDSRIRLVAKVDSLEERTSGTLIRFTMTIEVEGAERPAMVATQMALALP